MRGRPSETRSNLPTAQLRGAAPQAAKGAPRWSLSIGWSAALVLVALLNALCFPLIAVGLRDAPRLAFATLRALLAGLVLAVPAMLQRRPLPREPCIWLALAAIGLGTTSLGFLGMFDAGELVAPGLATVLLNTQPLIAAVLAAGFLHERTSASGLVRVAYLGSGSSWAVSRSFSERSRIHRRRSAPAAEDRAASECPDLYVGATDSRRFREALGTVHGHSVP